MTTVSLNTDFVSNKLLCPAGKGRIEFCDSELPGLYIAVSSASPGRGTYFLRYKDGAGKTCHHKIGRTTDISLSEARRKAKDQKAEIQLGADPSGEEKARRAVPTLAEFFAESYMPHAKVHKRSWQKDESLFRLRITEPFGRVRLNDLKRQPLQAFHTQLLTQGIGPATADHHIKLVRQVLNKAVEWEVIAVNPIARIKLFNADNRMENYMAPAELEKLLLLLRTDDNRPVCNVAIFLLATGARLNEALSATWENIDRPNVVWRIPAPNSKSKRARSVPLNDAALDVLGHLGTEGKSPFLFVSEKTGERLGHVHKVWDRLRNTAGLPKLRLHDLRHQYASFLVNSGRSLYEVQKILGHSSHSVTERYAHLSSKSLMDAANTASVFIKGAMPAAA